MAGPTATHAYTRRLMRVTVAIPTLNAGAMFRSVIDAVVAEGPDQVLVIDSGSADDTPAIARRAGASVHEIPNSEFGHGRTRNLAAELAETEVVAYLTQDAEPLPGWLAHLVRPLELSDRIVASFGRQVARPGVRAPVRRELDDVARQLGPTDGIVVRGRELVGADPSWGSQFFTNVTSAVRLDILRQIPFRDVSYAEDQALVTDLHEAGHFTAYAPLARVLHSHDYPLTTYIRRAYDDTVGLRTSTGRRAKGGLAHHLGVAAVLAVKDGATAIRSDDPLPRRLTQVASSPAFELGRRLAIALGQKPRPGAVHRTLSLEVRRRRGR